MVEYFPGVSNQYYTTTIHLFSNQEYVKEIPNGYKNYKIDYITGTKEDCKVDIKRKFNNSEYIPITTLSKNKKRIILDIEELYIISKNCDAVLTIITNYIYGYKSYTFNSKFYNLKLPLGKICLFQIPKPQYNIRTFQFEVTKSYDFGTEKACPEFGIGIISIANLFIEEPVNHVYIYVGGKSKYYNILNPYFYPNEAEKIMKNTILLYLINVLLVSLLK